MNEDEIVAWLSEAKAPIKRSGALNKLEVARALTEYRKNGDTLLEEALLLASLGKLPRAAALTILALEELAKVPLLANTFVHHQRGIAPAAWDEYWKTGGAHRKKQEAILSYGRIVRGLFDGDPKFSKRLYKHYPPDELFARLDAFKQSNLYVDVREDGVHAPQSDPKLHSSLDYLMAFGQERADSFCSWHVSDRRGVDFLDLALGQRHAQNWTSSYTVAEIAADIIYQASSLSASDVPDYSTFYDYVQQYKRKASERRLKEALIGLAPKMRSRARLSSELPRFN